MPKNVAVVIDKASGYPIMVVVPDHDSQLSDASFNPPNSMQVLVPMEKFQIQTHQQLQDIIQTSTARIAATASAKTEASKKKVQK